jgi:hypothetical protein
MDMDQTAETFGSAINFIHHNIVYNLSGWDRKLVVLPKK